MGSRGTTNQSASTNYIRFGEIPTNERSLNWLSLTFDDADIIQELLQDNPNEAYKRLHEANMESGVSVYKIDSNGNPDINNLQGLSTLSILLRDNATIYNVKGKKVGVGNDGEPTIKNVKDVKQSNLSKKELHKYIYDKLKANYTEMSGTYKFDNSTVMKFFDSENNKDIVSFGGVDFSKPKKGFDDSLGLKIGNRTRIKQYKTEFTEIPLSKYLKDNKVKVTKFTSKTGKPMVKFINPENNREISYTETQYKNKTVMKEKTILK